MSTQKKKISELPVSTSFEGLYTIGVDAQNRSVKVPIERLLTQGEQGIQGEAGIQGEQGEQGEAGIQGIQGEAGIQGEQGEAGIQGEQVSKQIEKHDLSAESHADIRRLIDGLSTNSPFVNIDNINENFTVDYDVNPNVTILLTTEYSSFKISIINTKNGDIGYITVSQAGDIFIEFSDNIVGEILMPRTKGTLILIKYIHVLDKIYVSSSDIKGDHGYVIPTTIKDLVCTYYDFTSASLKWASPPPGNEKIKVDKYDIRYSNSRVDADDPKIWQSLSRLSIDIEVANIGEDQTVSISNLEANKEFYVYIKSIAINKSISYVSNASNIAYFRTLSTNDTSKYYRVDIQPEQIHSQTNTTTVLNEGTLHCTVDKMVDEQENNKYNEDGYPDTTNKNFSTYAEAYRYDRDTFYYSYVIDLYNPYVMDRLFLFTHSRLEMSAYRLENLGEDWEKIGELTVQNNAWADIDFKKAKCRFVKISFDRFYIGEYDKLEEGVEGWLSNNEYGRVSPISNLQLYGRPISNVPEGIHPPRRRAFPQYSVDQVICTNSHGYQNGRIHSMFSGEKIRMYIGYNQFLPEFDSTPELFSRIADLKFRVTEIPWTLYNNGNGDNFQELLENSYKKYGLKPFLCNSDLTLTLFRHNQSAYNQVWTNRALDQYWLPEGHIIKPKGGVGGLIDYYKVTHDPQSYKTMAKICETLAKKYGKVDFGDMEFYPIDTNQKTGLDLISGLEIENEPNKGWEGFMGYIASGEYAALNSAVSDGHCGTLLDEDGNVITGVKGKGILSISSGLAETQPGYMLNNFIHQKSVRKMGDIGNDVLNIHVYCSNSVGGQHDTSGGESLFGVTLEEYLETTTGSHLLEFIKVRDMYSPKTPIYLTEFGYGESGGRGTKSKFQCYSFAGRYVDGWLIPDVHRSVVKGSWLIRGILTGLRIGISITNVYSTECDSTYFGASQWHQGAGFEMWDWNKMTDTTPSAKYNAIKEHEVPFDRPAFSSMGIFGHIMTNGAYPITNAYWMLSTVSKRLKGYTYMGSKYVENSRVVITCFINSNEDKGAYVIHYNNSINMGAKDVMIPLPDGVASYDKINYYYPTITDPRDVPANLAVDKQRTGMPTSRKEAYVSGVWVVQNKPYHGNKCASYTRELAEYPNNPKEGDEVTILPTQEENPYFPMVGTVGGKLSGNRNTLAANQWEQDRQDWQEEPNLDSEGVPIIVVGQHFDWAWRQVHAVCDFIEYHPEGVRGAVGDVVTNEAVKGCILDNITEIPYIYMFDAIPEPDFKSHIKNLKANSITEDTIELWWNNTSLEDTGYKVFISEYPESGFSPNSTVSVGIENKAVITGLQPETTYYFKIQPIKNSQVGELSPTVSITTGKSIVAVDGLTISNKTATAIRLEWEYDFLNAEDFYNYSIYRSSDTEGYEVVHTIEDRSMLNYTDEGLNPGKTYNYKIRVIGLYGQSLYSEVVSDRTFLPEEVSPFPTFAETDKLGTRVQIRFDLSLLSTDSLDAFEFTLLEDGIAKEITRVGVSLNNSNFLNLYVEEGVLQDHSQSLPIEVSYTGTTLKSIYDIQVDTFSKIRIRNIIGRIDNLKSAYQINITDQTTAVPEWNNLTSTGVSNVLDSWGLGSNISMEFIEERPKFVWGAFNSAGYSEIPDIPEEVYKYGRAVDYFCTNEELIVSRIRLSGLDAKYKYAIEAYFGTKLGGSKIMKIKVNDVYSNSVEGLGNTTNTVLIENIVSEDGTLVIDFVPESDVMGFSPRPSFFIIKEYYPSDSVADIDVYIRDLSFVENDGTNSTTDRNINIHTNYIGSPTEYRVSQVDTFDGADWKNAGSLPDIPFNIEGDYGLKTIYLQFRNTTSLSNIDSFNLTYRAATF